MNELKAACFKCFTSCELSFPHVSVFPPHFPVKHLSGRVCVLSCYKVLTGIMELLMELPHISCVITLSQTQTHTYKSTQSHIHTPLFTSRCSLISVDQYKDPLDSGLCTQGWRFALKSHPYTLFYLLNTYTCKNAHLCSHIVHPQMHAVTYSMHACTHSHSCDVCKNKQIRITTHTCTHMLVLCSIYMHRYAVS